MKILVTGASGLIGCHAVAALLDAGHEVSALARSPEKLDGALKPLGRSARAIAIVPGNLEDPASIRRAMNGQQGFLHCAGRFSPSLADAALLHRTNVDGTRSALEAAAAAGLERIVHLSSMLALFPPRGLVMTAEDPVARPRSMYAVTKARAEEIAREIQARAPVTIVYPAAVQGPYDPTFSIGPRNVATALRDRKALVTDGGLPYTDVRDLAALIVAIFGSLLDSSRVMAPSFFVRHSDYRELLERLTGHEIRAQKMPGWAIRLMGRAGDLVQRFGRDVQLTYEAAEVLTRSVPIDDRVARRVLGREALSAEDSFRDLIFWMAEAGHVAASDAGRLGGFGRGVSVRSDRSDEAGLSSR